MAINKKLIHFDKFNTFNSKRLSANANNDQYTIGISGEKFSGSPDILYHSIVYIKDTKQQWTHGQLYHGNLPPELSGGSAAEEKPTLVGGVSISDYNLSVDKKTLSAGSNISISGTKDSIIISATDTTDININALSADDDVVVLTGVGGNNQVKYTANHAKTFGNTTSPYSAKYSSGNSATSISGSGGSGTIKIPKLVVDEYGHVRAGSDASVSITMPTIPTALKNPNALTIQKNGTAVTDGVYDGSAAKTVNITVPTKHTDLTNDLKSLKFGSRTYNGSSEETITAADLGLSAALKYCGVTTTALTDGSTASSVTINGTSHTATTGCVVFYDNKEYVYNGTNWEELGYARVLTLNQVTTDANSNSTAVSSANHTHSVPADSTNTVSVSTSGHTHTVAQSTSTGSTVASSTHTHKLTAAGSVTSAFSGTESTVDATSTTGISVAKGDHTHSFTPAGSVSSSFTGSSVNTGSASSNTISVAKAAHTHSVTGTVSNGGASHSHSFTPSGTVSSSFTGSSVTSGTPSNSTSVATAAHTHTSASAGSHSHTVTASGNVTLTGTASGGILVISASFAGTSATTSSNGSHTHDVNATADNTTNRVSVATSAHTHDVTASGSVSSSFTGKSGTTGNTTATHSHTFSSGSASATADNTTNRVSVPTTSHTHSVTASGSVTSSFSGTASSVSATASTNRVTTAAQDHTHKYTPEGSVVSSFTGDESTTSSISGTISVASTSHTHTASANSSSVASVSKSNHNHTANASSSYVNVASDGHTHTVTPTGSIS